MSDGSSNKIPTVVDALTRHFDRLEGDPSFNSSNDGNSSEALLEPLYILNESIELKDSNLEEDGH
jgi:hypothetical protein